MCKDYITEKFWAKAIKHGVVPVVMGPPREDYEKVAPPSSFIHVEDFKSVRELADYLIELNNNDELYGKYLRWMSARENNEIWEKDFTRTKPNGICALCEKLKQSAAQKEVKSEVVTNLDEWWFGKGYSHNSEKFSVCSHKSSASGNPLRWYLTFGYNFFFLILGMIWATSCCYCKNIRTKICLPNNRKLLTKMARTQ